MAYIANAAPAGTGSGFVWDAAGHVVTNNHVVDGASAVNIRLASGEVVPASIAGTAANWEQAPAWYKVVMLATVLSYVGLAALQLLVTTDRRSWRGPRLRVVLPLAVALGIAAASLFVPQDALWNWFRVAGVVACLPWFFRRLRAARGGTA